MNKVLAFITILCFMVTVFCVTWVVYTTNSRDVETQAPTTEEYKNDATIPVTTEEITTIDSAMMEVHRLITSDYQFKALVEDSYFNILDYILKRGTFEENKYITELVIGSNLFYDVEVLFNLENKVLITPKEDCMFELLGGTTVYNREFFQHILEDNNVTGDYFINSEYRDPDIYYIVGTDWNFGIINVLTRTLTWKSTDFRDYKYGEEETKALLTAGSDYTFELTTNEDTTNDLGFPDYLYEKFKEVFGTSVKSLLENIKMFCNVNNYSILDSGIFNMGGGDGEVVWFCITTDNNTKYFYGTAKPGGWCTLSVEDYR